MRRSGWASAVGLSAALLIGLPTVPSTVSANEISCAAITTSSPPATATGSFHALTPLRLVDTRQRLGAVNAGCTLAVDVPVSIPTDATAVVLSVTADRSAAAGFLTVFPCGSARPDASNVNVRAGTPTANVAIAALDGTRRTCVFTSVATDLVVDVTGYLGANGDAFQETAPHRAVDTRFPDQRPDGGVDPIGPGVLTIPRSSLGVATDAAAVIVNVTATRTHASGFLTAFPCAASVPDTSNVNFLAGEDRANQAIVGLAGDGSLCIFASAPTDVIVDVTGVFAGSEGLPFASNVGTRLADSRNGIGGWSTPFAAGERRVVNVPLPAGTRTVLVDVVATRASAAGFLSVVPCGETPNTSSVNFVRGRDVANLVAMSVGRMEVSICVFASAPTDVVVDLFGAFVADGMLRTLTFGAGTPPVTPAFQPYIHDYAARCTAGTNTFDVHALGMPGTSVAIDGQGETQTAARSVSKAEDDAVVVSANGDEYWIRCLPHDFPPLTVSRPGQPSPGWYLVANVQFFPGDPSGPFAMILDVHGTPVWYRRPVNGAPVDFKRLSTGDVTWMSSAGAFGVNPSQGYEIRHLDGTLVRQVKATGGPTDHHDLVELPNGHFLVLTYVSHSIASRPCVNGNLPNEAETATQQVDGRIEEIDPNGIVVSSWNSNMHLDDGSPGLSDLCFNIGGTWIRDPHHLNSLDVTADGDVIVSARHLDAVFRIRWPAGNVEWQLGGGTLRTSDAGAKLLTFVGDSDGGIARQHDAKVMANGDISLFDNRTGFSVAPVSGAARAVEYHIDATAGTATLVRSQTRPDGFASGAMGSVQWADDGGALVGWGALPPVVFTEFDAHGSELFSVSFPPGHFSYRAVKEPPASFDVNVLRQTAGT